MVDQLSFVLGVTATVLAWLFFKTELLVALSGLNFSFEGISKSSAFSIVVVPLLIILPGLLLLKLKSERAGPHPRWTQTITKDNYEDQARDFTQAQLQQLYKSPKFKEMMRKRGNDPRQWCWQSKQEGGSSEGEDM
mmetsp:Transcript_10708/g.20833  ORF Transcript_10708/g.20833 Transcript_10708/m.20833 type:complete len:136 (+) Transcript_10708:2077-2484(+)